MQNGKRKMGVEYERNDFERGEVIGCYICKKYVQEIAPMLHAPCSTVNDVPGKWKLGGATIVHRRPGRPFRLTNRDPRVLKRIAKQNRI